MNKSLITAIIEKDDFGYLAYCPELKGCQTQGDTFEEALANLKEATELYLETYNGDLSHVFNKQIFSTSLEVEFS